MTRDTMEKIMTMDKLIAKISASTLVPSSMVTINKSAAPALKLMDVTLKNGMMTQQMTKDTLQMKKMS